MRGWTSEYRTCRPLARMITATPVKLQGSSGRKSVWLDDAFSLVDR